MLKSRIFWQVTALLVFCSCSAKSAEQHVGANRQDSKMEILSNSPSGEFAVNVLWKSVDGGLVFTFELIRVISYAENQYEIIDTIPGDLGGVGFCGDSVVYWIKYDTTSSRLGMSLIHNLDSTIVVFERIYDGRIEKADFAIDDRSKFRIEDSLISSRDGLWRIDSVGTPVSILQIQNKLQDAFSLDGSEYLFEVRGERDSLGNPSFEIYSFSISDSSVTYEFAEILVLPIAMSSRGIGQPIYYLQYSQDYECFIIWKFDRETRQKIMLTDPTSPNRISNYVLLSDSLLCSIFGSDGITEFYKTIEVK